MEIVDLVFGFFDQLPGWVWKLALGAWGCFILAMLVFHITLGVRRGSQWKEAAKNLGFTHRNEDVVLPNTFRHLESFSLLMNRSGGTRCLDVLTGTQGRVLIWLLDHFTGKPRKGRTAVTMRTPELQMPHFRLWRKWSPGVMVVRSQAPEVVFPDDPSFSRKFFLSADDPETIRRLFDATVREYLARLFDRCRELEKENTNWLTVLMFHTLGRFEVEASGDSISVHLSRLIHPRGARDFLTLTSETLEFFRRRPIVPSKTQDEGRGVSTSSS